MPRKTWPLQQGIPTQFVLKFTNPLYEEMNITLATPQMQKKDGLLSKEDDNSNSNNDTNNNNEQIEGATQIRGKVSLPMFLPLSLSLSLSLSLYIYIYIYIPCIHD